MVDKKDTSFQYFTTALGIYYTLVGPAHRDYLINLSNINRYNLETKNYFLAYDGALAVENGLKNIYPENNDLRINGVYQLAASAFYYGAKEDAFLYYQKMIAVMVPYVNTNLDYLSEQEKKDYIKTFSTALNSYYHFVSSANQNSTYAKAETDALNIGLYNSVLQTKGAILNASAKTRNTILKNDNPELIKKYNQWMQTKAQIGKYSSMSIAEQKSSKINIEELKTLSNDLEKELSRESSVIKKRPLK